MEKVTKEVSINKEMQDNHELAINELNDKLDRQCTLNNNFKTDLETQHALIDRIIDEKVPRDGHDFADAKIMGDLTAKLENKTQGLKDELDSMKSSLNVVKIVNSLNFLDKFGVLEYELIEKISSKIRVVFFKGNRMLKFDSSNFRLKEKTLSNEIGQHGLSLSIPSYIINSTISPNIKDLHT